MKKIIIFLAVITIVIIILFLWQNKPQQISSPAPTPLQETPQLISTKPDPLDETIVSSTEVIELTFSRPLENVPEFKIKIEPKPDYRVELSGDKKTAKIIPVAPFELGTTYTLFVTQDSKFEGGGKLEKELNFHFRTIKYRGF